MMMIYNEVWTKIIAVVAEYTLPKNIATISKDLDISYSHTFNVVKLLESKNILTINKGGRDSNINITAKGKRLAILLKEIDTILEDD